MVLAEAHKHLSQGLDQSQIKSSFNRYYSYCNYFVTLMHTYINI